MVRVVVGGEAVFPGPRSKGRGERGQCSPPSVSASALQPTPLPFPGRCPCSFFPHPRPDPRFSDAQREDLHYFRCPKRDCASLTIS